MSEIVRPTRDGIHGRETISTQVELGGGLMALEFNAEGQLSSILSGSMCLPVPVILGPLAAPLPGRGALRAMAQAATRLGTLAVIYADEFGDDLREWACWLAPRVDPGTLDTLPVDWPFRYVELEADTPAEVSALYQSAIERWQEVVVAACLPLSAQAPTLAETWARAGVAVIRLYADDIGRDMDGRDLPTVLH